MVADLAYPFEISRGRRDGAARILHRLEEHRGDGVGSFELDGLGDAVGRPSPEGLDVGAERFGRTVEVGVRHPEAAGRDGLEGRLVFRQAGDRQCALRGAVICDRSRNDLVLTGFAGELEVLLGHLPCGLDGLRASTGEEHPVELARSVASQPLGELDRRRRRVSPQREEGQCLGLPGGGLGELGATVTDLHREQSGQPVQVAVAGVVEDRHAVAAGDDRRGDVGALPGEVQPKVVEHGVGERYARAMTSGHQVSEFESLRPHLMSVAYRLTGTVADAEDIVQEAWLRWDAQGPGEIARSASLVDDRRQPARAGPAAVGRPPAGKLHGPVVTGAGGDRVRRRRPAVDGGGPGGCPVCGDGGAGTPLARSAGRVRTARWICGAVRRGAQSSGETSGLPPASWRRGPAEAVTTSPPPEPDPSHNEVVGKLMAAMAVRRHGRRGGAAASRRDVHRRFQWQGAHGSSGHPRRGQGCAVHARARPTLRPVVRSPLAVGVLINGELGVYTAGLPA